ncbi:hypothetical protein P12x_003015 [Tundrisphaera lichenicola]|uniref:hypothetical protein n=1 Tax=Tundrisphaera lichenicola TaxID=2029860 RepID=UPI003EBEB720
MLAEDDDHRDYAAPPLWIAGVMGQLDAMEKRGARMDKPTLITLFTFAARLEIEDYPRPDVQRFHAKFLRLAWSGKTRAMRVDITPGRVEIATSDPQRRASAQATIWLSSVRELFAWYHPRVPATVTEDES